MKTRTKLAIAISAAVWMGPISEAVAGIDFTAGDWKVDISGNVNAFYVGSSCAPLEDGSVVNGGLACVGDNAGSVRNGLLPAALVFSGTTRQADLDVGVTIGLYPGINSSAAVGVNNGGNPSALQTPGIDARQAFFTFGDKSWGTVKMGRDIGIFAQDAILDDMTLLGMGTALGNGAPGNTSLGRIGLGYIYPDWEPQIIYITPDWSGFSASGGVFQPLDSGSYTKHTSPQFQVGASYKWGDPKGDGLFGKAWVDMVTQRYSLPTDTTFANNTSHTGTAFDAGVKVDIAGFEAVLYGYHGSGVGTTGLYILATSPAGNTRDSDGGYIQATYKFDRLKFGLSYGTSRLSLANDEQVYDNTGNPCAGAGINNINPACLLKSNSSVVAGVYYSLTKNITLVGEFIDTKSEAEGGNSATEKDYAIGGIIFF
jgi:predicted porin